MSTTLESSVQATDKAVAANSHAGAAFFCDLLKERGFDIRSQPNILIAGCGAGHEASAIQTTLRAVVEAVDIELDVDERLVPCDRLRFQQASVCELPFADASFDAIFYHHVIEHVDDPPGSLLELRRVLKKDGCLFIGTPNRNRLISAVGAHVQTEWDATLWNKLLENVYDWRDRLRGRFRNEYGAHAGFTKTELNEMLANHFHQRTWLTSEYLRHKYSGSRLAPVIRLATIPAFRWFAAPSIYVLCCRPVS